MIALADEERVVAAPGKLNTKQIIAAAVFRHPDGGYGTGINNSFNIGIDSDPDDIFSPRDIDLIDAFRIFHP